MDLDMIFDLLMKYRPGASHGDAQLRCSSKANSDNKTHYGLGVSRSEERDVECKRGWNTEEGYLPNLKKEKSAELQQTAVQMDESLPLGLLMVAEPATQSIRFHSANN
jgi:hypothetical protein